jgi:hypothetical protein
VHSYIIQLLVIHSYNRLKFKIKTHISMLNLVALNYSIEIFVEIWPIDIRNLNNGQKKKTTHDNPKSTTQKPKDRATRTPLKNRCWTQVLRKGRELRVNSWHFHPIFYSVFTARHVSNHCLFRFAVHKSICNRRQHTPCICVKGVGTSLCRQKITRGRLLQYDCVYRRAAGMSRLLHL